MLKLNIAKLRIIFLFHCNYPNNQITGDNMDEVNIEENELETDCSLIDIDKFSSTHSATTGKSCDRGDGDGAIWQKIHAEDSML